MIDVHELVQDVVPYVSAATAAYGSAVLQRVADTTEDAAADAAVGLGKRFLRRLFASHRSDEVRAAVADLAGRPGDPAPAAALRAQLVKAVGDDPALARDLRQILLEGAATGDRHRNTIIGGQGFQIGTGNTQHNTFPGAPGSAGPAAE